MTNEFTSASERKVDVAPSVERSYITVTNVLIALNVLVFIAMVARGVSFLEPTPRNGIAWGADFGPLTIGAGQWWRMLTACFVHFGIIHIGMNMFVLYQIGPFIETVFGRARYLIIYFFAGLFASATSLYIHPLTTSAGASGAIFGLYGAVFGFLLMERRSLAPGAVQSIGRSAGIFIIYNFIYGGVHRGTDLSAHIGGLLSGFIAGLLLVRPRAGGAWRIPLAGSVLVLAAVLGGSVIAVAQRPENRDPANGMLATFMTSASAPFGNDGEVLYSRDVTAADAKKLADSLGSTELAKVKGVVVVFSKAGGKITLSIPLAGDKANANTASNRKQVALWDDPEVVEEFTNLGDRVEPAVGSPFNVILLDGSGVPKRSLPIAAQ